MTITILTAIWRTVVAIAVLSAATWLLTLAYEWGMA